MGLDRKKFIAAVALFVLAISVPVTLSLLQQRQDNRSKAAASTTLSFSPSTINKSVGQTFTVDVMVNPGTNMVSYVKFEAKFNPAVLQIDSLTPFVPNTTAFPGLKTSVITSDSLKAEVSIGSDLTKAIKSPTKVGTLYFKTLAPSTSSSLTFSSFTQVLSINPTDGPIENVLSNTMPATVIVTASSTTPTPSTSSSPSPTNLTPSPTTAPTPTPTISPSAAPTAPIGGGGTGTPTPAPTATTAPTITTTTVPTTTSTITPTTATTGVQVNINLILHSIGIGGDSVNPLGNSFSTKNPVHASRSAVVTLHDAADIPVRVATGTIYYSSPSGVFIGSVTIPTTPTGFYTMRIRTDNHLTRRVPGIISWNNQTITLPALQYIAGDSNNDNKLNILDYNLMMNCYGASNAVTCNDSQKVATDFNDDGQVNQVDYNLFLRELSISFGD